jgi:hypothetical protein
VGQRPHASNSSTVAPPVNPVAAVTKTVPWLIPDLPRSLVRCHSTSKQYRCTIRCQLQSKRFWLIPAKKKGR